jgi:hypothetical protein
MNPLATWAEEILAIEEDDLQFKSILVQDVLWRFRNEAFEFVAKYINNSLDGARTELQGGFGAGYDLKQSGDHTYLYKNGQCWGMFKTSAIEQVDKPKF